MRGDSRQRNRTSTRKRTGLLIHCSVEEAAVIREQAHIQYRPVSNYILNIVMRSLHLEEMRISMGRPQDRPRRRRSLGLRTTMLIRCSHEEAAEIRRASKHKGMTISDFVLRFLRRSWEVAQALREGLSPLQDRE